MLKALLDGNVPADDEQRLVGHLGRCAACQAEFEQLSGSAEMGDDVARRLGGASGEPAPAVRRIVDEFTSWVIDGRHETEAGQSANADRDILEFLDTADSADALGRLGSYEVIEVVGRGGMGVVFKARDPALNRLVAIKVLAPHYADDQHARQRFLQEARAAAAINHLHIVTIHSVEESTGLPFIVMELVSGDSLQQRIDERGPLGLPEILRIGRQVAHGLAAAHAGKLIHRDIKPANILLEPGSLRVKITDFGLAGTVGDASVTQSGVLAGTPSYMSPEQASAKPIDRRADLFCLGSVMYAMCTGRPPFEGGSTADIIQQVRDADPTPVQQINPEIPDWLVVIVARLHAKDPADRYQSAVEVARLLKHRPDGGQALEGTATRPGRSGPDAETAPADATTASVVDVARGTTAKQKSPRWLVASLGSLAVLLGAFWASELAGLTDVFLRSDDVEPSRHGQSETDTPVAVNRSRASDGRVLVVRSDGAAGDREFTDLQAAVDQATAGQTIEIATDELITSPVRIADKPLRIVAARGVRPVITLDLGRITNADLGEPGVSLIQTNSPLVLEGLELRCVGEPGRPRTSRSPRACILAAESVRCVVRNCELLSRRGVGVEWFSPPDGRLVLDNCVGVGEVAVALLVRPGRRRRSIELTHNTLVGFHALRVFNGRSRGLDNVRNPVQSIRVQASSNLFGLRRSVVHYVGFPESHRSQKPGWVLQTLVFQNEQNLFARRAAFMTVASEDVHVSTQPPWGPETLDEWNRFWGRPVETDSLRGVVEFSELEIIRKLPTQLESLRPNDFRVAVDRSTPGSEGKGARIDLVGPGEAYERCKSTPAYEEWLGMVNRLLQPN